ncbi:hypothetical protein AS9A_0469 [Hoyosella subflava DQS3-9A1]|uniref:Uncharacterized protein n=1 Tax=Hoyosella subflava (strain DSM 45089 / JCM 17490 / NBRC 109087 / DQS3-9A1) TaxID=443218 RepID=F6EHX8_HOYSD|nr:hypothetical protein AS9A_0469 [Hoyosella subflava DQS3-9A1]
MQLVARDKPSVLRGASGTRSRCPSGQKNARRGDTPDRVDRRTMTGEQRQRIGSGTRPRAVVRLEWLLSILT